MAETDVYPIHWPLDTPFGACGPSATVFDAPGPTPPRANERGTAETFLAICPDGAGTQTVVLVLGVSWGYELEEMQATAFPPNISTGADWRRCLLTVTEACPEWQFKPEILCNETGMQSSVDLFTNSV